MDVCIVVREDLHELNMSHEIESALNRSDVHSLFAVKALQAKQSLRVTVLYVTTEAGRCLQKLKAYGADRIWRISVTNEILKDEVHLGRIVSNVLQDESFDIILIGESPNVRDSASCAAQIGAYLQLETFTEIDRLQFLNRKLKLIRSGFEIEESFVYSHPAVISLKQVPGFRPIISMWDIFREYDTEVVDFPINMNEQAEINQIVVHPAKDKKIEEQKIYNKDNHGDNVIEFVKDFAKDIHF